MAVPSRPLKGARAEGRGGGKHSGGTVRLKHWIIIAAVILAAVISGGVYAVAHPFLLTFLAATTRNYFVSLGAPTGTIAIEANPSYAGPPAVAPSPATTPPGRGAAEWPMYNRTLTSDRYSPLSLIDTKNVSELKVLCTYDTNQWVDFESGLIMVENAVIGTTQFDIFSIDPKQGTGKIVVLGLDSTSANR